MAGVLIDEKLAERLALLDAYFQQQGVYSIAGKKTQPINNQKQIYVRNDETEAAPPYACMQVIDTVEEAGQNYLIVEKPIDSDGAAGWYVFNGPNEIEASGGFGIAFDGPLCRMLTDGSTVTAGDVWGPVASQWTIAPSGSLFVAAGEDDIAADVMRGFFKGGGSGSELMAARMTEAWTTKQATSEIYSFDGVTLTYVENAEVYDPLAVFASLGNGDWLYITKQAGKYYAGNNASCAGLSPLIADPPESGPS